MKYKLMLQDIKELVESDFCSDMECKVYLHPEKPEKITQEEAKRMVDILTEIYKIAHTVSCTACRKNRYK